MVDERDRSVAFLLGLLGAVLVGAEALLVLATALVRLVSGHLAHPLDPLSRTVVLAVFALLVGAFSLMGRSRRDERPTVAGAVLIVLAVAGWLFLDTGAGLLGVLGTLLALVAGVVFLVAGR